MRGSRLRISAEFVTSAASARDFPRDRLAEVALVGRSNVGKSSLINALVRQNVARTSAAPGKTRLANFYRVRRGSAPAFYLVDLPGYGYARVAKRGPQPFDRLRVAPSSVEGQGSAPHPREQGFEQLTADYFGRCGGAGLHPSTGARGALNNVEGHGLRIAVLLLVDARHPGLESDLDAWAWLDTQPCHRGVIGTKADKLTRADRARHARQLASLFDVPVPLVSAPTGEGLDELWKVIATISQTAP